MLSFLAQRLSTYAVYKVDKLSGRTVWAIRKQIKSFDSIVQTKQTAIVQTIKPAILEKTPCDFNVEGGGVGAICEVV